MNKLTPIANNLMSYCQKHLGYDQSPQLSFEEDQENANQKLGKTAYYSPEEKKIVVFISNRHPKDILRSIAHELVHHNQNCRGEFEKSHSTDPGYAQKDPHLRNMEKEAYLKGNMLFRDWEDQYKTKQLKENIKMNDENIKEIIRNELREAVKNGQEIDEGLFDRIRSRVAGAGAAIKGMAGNVKKAGKYVGSGDAKDLEGGVNAKAAYRQRKADSMIKASAKKILAVHKELLNDLTKTGLMDKSGDSDVVNVNMIKQGLARLNQGITMMTKAASAEGAEKIAKVRNPEATNEEELEEADERLIDKDYPHLKGKVKPVRAGDQPRKKPKTPGEIKGGEKHKKNRLKEGSMKKTDRFKEKTKEEKPQQVTHKEDKDLGTGTVVSRKGNTVQVKWPSGQRSHDHNMLKPVNETNTEDLRIPENADALNEALYGNRRAVLNKRLVEWAKK